MSGMNRSVLSHQRQEVDSASGRLGNGWQNAWGEENRIDGLQREAAGCGEERRLSFCVRAQGFSQRPRAMRDLSVSSVGNSSGLTACPKAEPTIMLTFLKNYIGE